MSLWKKMEVEEKAVVERLTSKKQFKEHVIRRQIRKNQSSERPDIEKQQIQDMSLVLTGMPKEVAFSLSTKIW